MRISSSCIRVLITLGVCALLVGLASRQQVRLPTVEPYHSESAQDRHPVGPIFTDTVVRQEFVAGSGRIASLELLLATFGVSSGYGTLTLTVEAEIGGKWAEVARRTVKRRRIRDNEFHEFMFRPPLRVQPGHKVALILSADIDREHAVTWWTSANSRPAEQRLAFNGEPRNEVGVFHINYAPLAGRATGPTLRSTVWKRLTSFLAFPEQLMLVLGGAFGLFAFVHLLLWPNPVRRHEG